MLQDKLLKEEQCATRVPGGVYLCQVDERVSCGACCGLYNARNASRARLEALLAERTERFREVPRTEDAIDAFRLDYERREPQPRRPFPDFYHCPFLGFVAPDRTRVGCLLHPLAAGNGGVDYRGLSFYGGMACREYFCPSHRGLPAVYKEILREVCSDWYVYGLMATEERMLAAFFGEAERRAGRALKLEDVTARPAARAAVGRFLELKTDWPFRPPQRRGPVNYFFDDGLYPQPPIDYARLGVAPSAHDTILRELGSEFDGPAGLKAAEAVVEELLRAIAGQESTGLAGPAGDAGRVEPSRRPVL